MEALFKRLEKSTGVRCSVIRPKGNILLAADAAPGRIRDLLQRLRDREGFAHLVLISAVDRIEDLQFQITWILHQPADKADIIVRTRIPRNMPEMESVHDLWPAAAVYQRELHEMYGINFPGSPHQDEPLILEGWTEIPPMRRDFDTKAYAEARFFPRPGRETKDPQKWMEQNYAGEATVKKAVKERVRTNRKENADA